jgi:putative ABC transport system substrate-binding protein
VEGLRAGLKELGIAEGRDLVLDIRSGRGNVKTIEDIARQFEREQVALVYSAPTTTTRAVKRATSSVPVVFCAGSDPVHMGLVQTYAKPGGRFTGVHYLTADLTPKRLELLKNLVPKARRIITFYNPDNPAAQESARSAREAAPHFGLQLVERHVRSEADIRDALGALKPGEADAIFYVSDATVSARSELIINRAKVLRMPTMVFDLRLAERGALASYGVDTREVGRQSAKYVQHVLAGIRPADLPVENVTRLVFVLNQRTAREIGLPVPPAMLVQFDRVIE